MIVFLRKIRLAALLLIALPAYSVAEDNGGPWAKRASTEEQWREMGLSMVPHQSNYFFPVTYNTSPHSSSRNPEEHVEAKFQLSLKVLLLRDILSYSSQLYFGYTQLSLWQVYDRSRSAPFRDTNHEPELFLTFDTRRELGALTLRQWDLGVVHESNGVDDPDSRSWNRVYANFHLDRQNLSLNVKPWLRLPERQADDENRDIMKYMGYGEVTLAFFLRNHVLSVMLRNNLRPRDNKGAIEVDYSFPLTRNLTGLLQYFGGYGESLLDYNRPNHRYSIGLALNEWR